MRRHSFTGCDRKDSEVSRFALACSTSRTRISCAHPAILNVRETEDLEPVCPGLRLKSLRWATPVKSLRRPGSHNRPGQQTYPRSKLQRVYIICKTVTPWLHSGPTVPSAACRRGLVFPTAPTAFAIVLGSTAHVDSFSYPLSSSHWGAARRGRQ